MISCPRLVVRLWNWSDELVSIAMVAVIVIVLRGGNEGDAAEDLGEAGLADDGELLRGGLCGVGVG